MLNLNLNFTVIHEHIIRESEYLFQFKHTVKPSLKATSM